jgi:[ribosomal protein S5]-alanine N-acetyltransferase
MASREQPQQGLTGLGGFGRHHWPVTLRHGPVILAPLRHRDRAAWERVRRENATWLRPW